MKDFEDFDKEFDRTLKTTLRCGVAASVIGVGLAVGSTVFVGWVVYKLLQFWGVV